MKNQESVSTAKSASPICKNNQNIFVADNGHYVNLKPLEILWVSSEGNYAHIHTKEKQFTNRISLASLLKLLPAQDFIKIHKCYIVQIDAIEHIDKAKNEMVVNGKTLPIGRSYKSTLLSGLQLIT